MPTMVGYVGPDSIGDMPAWAFYVDVEIFPDALLVDGEWFELPMVQIACMRWHVQQAVRERVRDAIDHIMSGG